jgi:hypothetical protein
MTACKQVGQESSVCEFIPTIDPYLNASPEMRVLHDSCCALTQRLARHAKLGGELSQEHKAKDIENIQREANRIARVFEGKQREIHDAAMVIKYSWRGALKLVRALLVPYLGVLYLQNSVEERWQTTPALDDKRCPVPKMCVYDNDKVAAGFFTVWLLDPSVRLVAKSEFSELEKQEADRKVVHDLAQKIKALKKSVDDLRTGSVANAQVERKEEPLPPYVVTIVTIKN